MVSERDKEVVQNKSRHIKNRKMHQHQHEGVSRTVEKNFKGMVSPLEFPRIREKLPADLKASEYSKHHT